MSTTELHQGRVTPIETTVRLSIWAEGYCKMNGIEEMATYNDDWIEQLQDSFYKKFLIIDDKIYQIEDTETDPDDDIVEVTKNKDGSYDYMLKFYNGGACLTELLENEIRKS